ncbi:MAG TPA: hypothetical protein VL614_00535 [Acetobacteraceae bacterium]|jgi:hypothetical protein|nr:hypothetical protein [Acetobacteraceae bacterium]
MTHPSDPETLAREINEQPWDPLPGMVKRRCIECEYWYAGPPEQRVAFCPECEILQRRGMGYRGRHQPSR